MARLTDGSRTVEIAMRVWEGTSYSADISDDFFSVGELRYNYEASAYIVNDVDYCIEVAELWESGRWEGDEYVTDEEVANRRIDWEEVDF